ncbi:winged helix-turn-helix domain-containing protein [Desulfocurvibacter africanus]|uniref:winged helix-turn-helix domain-containing protein n=1 Tax=Desulfocurvibacter africanus TaxID=873 RepID=UPI000404EAD7|nr:LysR family transcriptional regulator [Desulfocurvibacter africanus]
MDEHHPTVRMHLWLETEDGVFFGLGRLKLLESIESSGSLKAAAISLGMSYRAAWGKIKRTERVLGFALIEKTAGNRTGYRLTEAGVLLKDSYRRWLDDVERMALERGSQLLPCIPRKYVQDDEEPLVCDCLANAVPAG